ncbi:MAG: Gfo/Idh/MocA family oxidoreductase [Microcoleaceae cyanobacterium]
MAKPVDRLILKVGVIGTGLISKEHLYYLSESDRTRIIGVCDLSKAAAHYATQRFGAETFYTNYHQMLNEAKPDVVHILTPPHTHKAIAMDCLKAGAHVICEKPVTPTYEEFKELWSFAKQCDRYLIENQNYRYNQPILELQKLVEDGTLGEVQDVEVRMALDIRSEGRYADENLPSPLHNLPAGVIHDFITHLSYLTLLFIQDFDDVKVAWNNYGGGDLFKYDDLDALVFAGSKHARIRFSCYTQPDCFSIIVRGSRGYAEADLFQPYVRCIVPRAVGQKLSPLVNQFSNGWTLINSSVNNFQRKLLQKTPYEGLHYLLDETYKALQENRQPPIGYQEMEVTSRLVNALVTEESHLSLVKNC